MSVSKEIPDYRILLMLLLGFWFFVIYLLLQSGNDLRIGKLVISKSVFNLLSLYLFFVFDKITQPFFARFNKILRKKKFSGDATGGRSKTWKKFLRFKPDAKLIINWGGHTLGYFLISAFPIFLGSLLGSIGLIFFALSCFNILGIIFVCIKKIFGYPILPIFLIAVIIFTGISDNNTAGYISANKQDTRESLDNHFESWIRKRAIKEDTIKISLVAAEGGGLRSASWTYGVMRKLQVEHPEFYDQLYAVSCVSGGSVGAALFCTEQFTGLSEDINKAPILGNDNLSSMVAALFYREFIQSVIPVDVDFLDRSRVMDKTFETFWQQKHPGNHLWSDNFLELWNHQKQVPVLLVNSIHVENGENVILSNLKFIPKKLQCVDMYQIAENTMSLSQVVGISSRFPYLQPAARFKYPDGSSWGHLADGGYFENSGVYTLYRVYLSLREKIHKMKWPGKIPVIKFSILLLSNGEENRPDRPGFFLNEIGSPLNTLLNSWYTKGYSYANIARETVQLINSNDQFFEIRLDRKKSAIPLGWFLSLKSKNEIIRQLDELDSTDGYKAYTSFSFN
jgi:hypothetical protein